jgi:hypothetical protein
MEVFIVQLKMKWKFWIRCTIQYLLGLIIFLLGIFEFTVIHSDLL